jgi:hypothetical protein
MVRRGCVWLRRRRLRRLEQLERHVRLERL